ncbi:D-alanine aminotransferase [Stieleria maiorica]|uniref:D-alanine aminotransferase n=1 Tax=Stieleria maiorica TaxID=2795974 RepID=A0A5B9MHI2_9BACT|nr:aminotransferase class IV [Stieleria maiorica]QEF99969.1 D-alanine aminotransferase [Stieleria maiorica]
MESDPSASDSDRPQVPRAVRLAYHNGQWIPGDKLCIPMRDPAVTQAVTAVERVRVYNGRLFQIDRHLDRWQHTTDALAITGLPSRQELAEQIDEVIRRNDAWLQTQNEFGVLWFASPGIAGSPTLVIDLYPIDSALMQRRINSGSPLIVTSVRQPSAECWPRNIKVRCRLHYYLADREATRQNPGSLGILLDSDGSITETSIANVLIVHAGEVVSPPDDQVLQGVSRDVVRELCDALDIPWRERRIYPDELRAADEVLLTGTSCGLWFANSIDGSPLRSAGPVYQRLRAGFDALVADH